MKKSAVSFPDRLRARSVVGASRYVPNVDSSAEGLREELASPWGGGPEAIFERDVGRRLLRSTRMIPTTRWR
jgi:hypothetical protein